MLQLDCNVGSENVRICAYLLCRFSFECRIETRSTANKEALFRFLVELNIYPPGLSVVPVDLFVWRMEMAARSNNRGSVSRARTADTLPLLAAPYNEQPGEFSFSCCRAHRS